MSKPNTENEFQGAVICLDQFDAAEPPGKKFSAAFPTEKKIKSAANPWEDDRLGRKSIADKLINLAENAMVEDANSAFVMSVHGEWGTGKTFMLKRLQQQLKNNNRTAIYFNAWEDDFSTDPLTAIIGQLYHSLNDIKSADDWRKKAKEFLVSSLSAVKKSLKNHALSYAKLEEGDVSSNARKTLENYSDSREEIKQIRKSLCDFTNVIKEETKFPLVFIIDELDRCRPTFALEVLERVKHLFNVPGIVFIFGINKKSLEKSIEAAYGDIDASDYLRRFFHLELNLPTVDSRKFTQNLLEEHHVFDFLNSNKLFFESGWSSIMDRDYLILVQMMGLTLREVEYSVRLISLMLKGKQHGSYSLAECWVAMCLVLLKVKLPKLYEEFIRGECRCNKVVDEIWKIMRDGGNAENTEQIEGAGQVEEAERIRKLVNVSFCRFASSEERSGMSEEMKDILAFGTSIKSEFSYEVGMLRGRRPVGGNATIITSNDERISLNQFVALLDLVDNSSQE